MDARHPQAFTTEDWNGFWGLDARYYARRSDGACFVIDGAAMVFDLANESISARHSERVASLPRAGRYAMRVLVAKPASDARPGSGRLFACGVRRRVQR